MESSSREQTGKLREYCGLLWEVMTLGMVGETAVVTQWSSRRDLVVDTPSGFHIAYSICQHG